jgi:hypothetical protein
MPEYTPKESAGLYTASTTHLMKILNGVRIGQLDDRTPCSEWNVRDLIMHCIGGQQFAGGMLTGKPTGIEFGDIATLEPVPDDAAAMSAVYQRTIGARMSGPRPS